MKFWHWLVHDWLVFGNWRISSYVKLVRLRKPKITCSLSYEDYRLKTNAVILLDMGHTLRGDSTLQDREREGNQKLEYG
jgi:hypothetical protein